MSALYTWTTNNHTHHAISDIKYYLYIKVIVLSIEKMLFGINAIEKGKNATYLDTFRIFCF